MLLKKQVWGGRSPDNSELPMSTFHFQIPKEGSAPASRETGSGCLGGEWRQGGNLRRDVDACPPMTPLFTERLTQEEALCCRLPAAL